MRRVETTIDVGDDRRVELQLPDDVLPGAHRVVLIVDDEASQSDSDVEQPLKRVGGVLVYTGRLVGDPTSILDGVRDDRLRKLADTR